MSSVWIVWRFLIFFFNSSSSSADEWTRKIEFWDVVQPSSSSSSAAWFFELMWTAASSSCFMKIVFCFFGGMGVGGSCVCLLWSVVVGWLIGHWTWKYCDYYFPGGKIEKDRMKSFSVRPPHVCRVSFFLWTTKKKSVVYFNYILEEYFGFEDACVVGIISDWKRRRRS